MDNFCQKEKFSSLNQRFYSFFGKTFLVFNVLTLLPALSNIKACGKLAFIFFASFFFFANDIIDDDECESIDLFMNNFLTKTNNNIE